ARHDTESAIRPKLAPRAKPVRRNYDSHDLSSQDRANTGASLELLCDRMLASLSKQLRFDLNAKFRETIELYIVCLRCPPLARGKSPKPALSVAFGVYIALRNRYAAR